jgi:glycosyltransferase involved in cell wall biosynthesis
MKILFLSHHWTHNSHHSAHSGMQKIVSYAALSNDVALVTWGPQAAEYQEGNIRVITVMSSGTDYLFSKRKAISHKGAEIAKEFDAVHSLYSDCTYHLPYKGFTMTLHVLPGIVKYKELRQNLFLFLKYHILQRRAFRRARHIACVSNNLLNALPAKHRPKACFIPHGVDTEFWDPALATAPADFPEGRYVLCVGAHGLDRQLLTDFVAANPTTPFVLVGARQSLGDFSNVHYLNKISDEELRNLYFGAGIMFRPLLFATANNSILEALALGTTVLASRIAGVTDYLTDDTCVFIDTLKDKSLSGMATLRLDPIRIRQTAIKKFSWNIVLDSYIELYKK